jgi:predicted nucleic acid-binding protein
MVIIDTGPLVALFDDSEPRHDECDEIMRSLRRPPVTTWPVLAEAFYLLGSWRKGQAELWDVILAGGICVEDIPSDRQSRLRELMEKYADNPMDLANASLVVIAEIHRIRKVFTLDRKDFERYRPKHCSHFQIIS